MLKRTAFVILCGLFILQCAPYHGGELYTLKNLASRAATAENIHAEAG